jgi:hypothetical protein
MHHHVQLENIVYLSLYLDFSSIVANAGLVIPHLFPMLLCSPEN